MDRQEMQDKLQELLARRDDYFQITELERIIYRKQFEAMQAEIIRLKIYLDLYHDELDIVSVKVDYSLPVDSKEKYKILDQAKDDREIKWLSKRFNFQNLMSEHLGLILKDVSQIKNDWLREICMMHQLKREGLIKCPWPTKLSEK